MNHTKEVRGVDKTVGNLLHAVPDAEEFMGELKEHEEALTKALDELSEARLKVRLAELALISEFDLLKATIQRGSKTLAAWKTDIQQGADDLAPLYPALGFRVVKTLPKEIA